MVWINYLLNRFQIIPLSLLVISDVLVVSRLTEEPALNYVLMGTLVMFYLFHNRVADDHRDYSFDSEHYKDRALQQGKLNLRTFNILAWLSILSILGICAYFGLQAFFCGLILVSVARWVRIDFGFSEDFKVDYFFLYNFLNMLQMLVLQISIYVILLGTIDFETSIWVHVAMIFMLSLHAEWTRKIQPQARPAMDYYSDRLGFGKSLRYWLVHGLFVVFITVILSGMLQLPSTYVIALQVVFILILFLGVIAFARWRNKKGENLFWAAFLLFYLGENLMISFLR